MPCDSNRKINSHWLYQKVYIAAKLSCHPPFLDKVRLNKVTKPISQSLPCLESIFSILWVIPSQLFFTTLDLSSGFWQLYVDPKTKHKASFTTAMGNYNFKRMPFGLVNAPASYTIMMNKVFQGLNWQFLLCYMDNIFIFSSNFDEHLGHLNLVFERLREATHIKTFEV